MVTQLHLRATLLLVANNYCIQTVSLSSNKQTITTKPLVHPHDYLLDPSLTGKGERVRIMIASPLTTNQRQPASHGQTAAIKT